MRRAEHVIVRPTRAAAKISLPPLVQPRHYIDVESREETKSEHFRDETKTAENLNKTHKVLKPLENIYREKTWQPEKPRAQRRRAAVAVACRVLAMAQDIFGARVPELGGRRGARRHARVQCSGCPSMATLPVARWLVRGVALCAC